MFEQELISLIKDNDYFSKYEKFYIKNLKNTNNQDHVKREIMINLLKAVIDSKIKPTLNNNNKNIKNL